jgi:hypothetical protein
MKCMRKLEDKLGFAAAAESARCPRRGAARARARTLLSSHDA